MVIYHWIDSFVEQLKYIKIVERVFFCCFALCYLIYYKLESIEQNWQTPVVFFLLFFLWRIFWISYKYRKTSNLSSFVDFVFLKDKKKYQINKMTRFKRFTFCGISIFFILSGALFSLPPFIRGIVETERKLQPLMVLFGIFVLYVGVERLSTCFIVYRGSSFFDKWEITNFLIIDF